MGIQYIQYINCSQTHECGNWDLGRAIPFLGIFVSNFLFGIVSLQRIADSMYEIVFSRYTIFPYLPERIYKYSKKYVDL
jgi:hypothetical protein